MIHARENGALYFQGQFFEKALYDFGNTRLLAQADGCGALSRFAVADRYNVFLPDSYYVHCSIADIAVCAHCEKTVSMLGRRQQVRFLERGIDVVWDTFLDEGEASVFQKMEISNSNAEPLDFRLDFGVLINARDMAARGQQDSFEHVKVVRQENGLYLQAAPGVGVYVACTGDIIVREVEYQGVHLSFRLFYRHQKQSASSLPSIGGKNQRRSWRLAPGCFRTLTGRIMTPKRTNVGFSRMPAAKRTWKRRNLPQA